MGEAGAGRSPYAARKHDHHNPLAGGKLVPTDALDVAGTADGTTFLRSDNTWADPSSSSTTSTGGSTTTTSTLTWVYDEWTVAGTPVTTYALSFIPTVDSIAVFLQGVWLRPTVDYSVNEVTGILTVTKTLSGGNILSAHYTTNGAAGATPGTISFIGTSTTASTTSPNTATSGSITLPGGISNNDYVFLSVAADDPGATMTTPTGFSILLGPTVAATGVGPKLWVFYRTAVAADSGAAKSLAFGGTINGWSAVSRVYRGATTFDAQAIQGNGSGTSTTVALPSLTLTNSGDLEIAFYAIVTTNGSLTLLDPTGYGHGAGASNTSSPYADGGSSDVIAAGTTDNPNNASCTIAATSVGAKVALVQ